MEWHVIVSRYNYQISDWMRNLPSVKYKSKRRNGKVLDENTGMDGIPTIYQLLPGKVVIPNHNITLVVQTATCY